MFREDKVKEVEDEFSRIVINPQQRRQVYAISKLLAQKVPISELALRGFIWKAIVKFQREDRVFFAEGEHFTPEERIRNTYRIAEHVRDNLIKILRRKADAISLQRRWRRQWSITRRTLRSVECFGGWVVVGWVSLGQDL